MTTIDGAPGGAALHRRADAGPGVVDQRRRHPGHLTVHRHRARQRPDQGGDLPGAVDQGPIGVPGHAGAAGGHLHDGHAVFDRGVAQPQVQDG